MLFIDISNPSVQIILDNNDSDNLAEHYLEETITIANT